MLVYKISRDQSIRIREFEIDFRTNIFASNPELYQEMFKEEKFESPEDLDIEELVPESEADVHRMLSQLKREGVIK